MTDCRTAHGGADETTSPAVVEGPEGNECVDHLAESSPAGRHSPLVQGSSQQGEEGDWSSFYGFSTRGAESPSPPAQGSSPPAAEGGSLFQGSSPQSVGSLSPLLPGSWRPGSPTTEIANADDNGAAASAAVGDPCGDGGAGAIAKPAPSSVDVGGAEDRDSPRKNRKNAQVEDGSAGEDLLGKMTRVDLWRPSTPRRRRSDNRQEERTPIRFDFGRLINGDSNPGPRRQTVIDLTESDNGQEEGK